MTDQAYAVAVLRFGDRTEVFTARYTFYIGAGMTLWTTWQIGTVIGALVGASIPESWALDFAVPLVFLSLLVPAVRQRPSAVAAIVAGITAVIAAPLGYNSGLLVAAAAGIAAGMLIPETDGAVA